MEKASHLSVFLLLLTLCSVVLSALSLAFCCASIGKTDTDAQASLAVSGNVSPASDVLVDEQQPMQESPTLLPSSASGDASSDEPTPPSYTVRLLPESSESTTRCIGIYDGAQTLIVQLSVPLATLSLSDRQALLDGIFAPDFDSAKLLLYDFCN